MGVRYSCVETRYYIVGSKRIRNIPTTKYVVRDSPTLREIGEMISDHHNSKQQEYRALAAFSQEPKLLRYYNEDKDLYQQIASELFNQPLEACGDGSEYRKKAKVILLAIAYGTGARTLAQQIGTTRNEAQKFLTDFKNNHPTLKQWIEDNQTFVQRHGFVWIGEQDRKRRLPDARNRDSDYWYTSVYTQSTNAIVQGSASIQTKVTLIELQKLCDKKDDWFILAPVHDEIIIDVPDTITREEIQEFVDVMTNSYRFGDLPNKTDVELYKRWSEGISIDDWFGDE